QSQLPVIDMLNWGWRIPYLMGVPIAGVALYMRLRIEETPAYEQISEIQQEPAGPARGEFERVVVRHRRSLLIVMGLVIAENVTNYMLTGYMPTYFKQVGGITAGEGLGIIVLVLAMMLVAV